MPVRVFLNGLNKLMIGSFLLAALSSGNDLPVFPMQVSAQARLQQFDFLTPISGWVLLDQHVFWTTDSGQTWLEVTPEIPPEASIEAVDFLDEDTGWVLWTTIAPDGSSLFQLSHTSDHGTTWATRPLALFESGEPASFAEKAQMDWFDSQTGWISIKQSSGSNFSLGRLFVTTDGGASWKSNKLPVADQVYFAESDMGWAVGGPSGDQVFETRDGGFTWKDVSPDHPASDIVTTYAPFFSNGEGFLVTTQLGSESFVNVYKYDHGQWSLFKKVKLEAQPGVIGLSILDPQNLVAVIPGTESILRVKNAELRSLRNADARSASIVDLDMLTLDVGWAKSIRSDCSNASSPNDQTVSISCAASTRLLKTINGGVTWDSVALPFVESSATPREAINGSGFTAESLPNVGNSQVFIGQGFDTCELPTVSQLQTWWDSSPYKSVNLYIGGSNRACSNLSLSATYLKTIHQQGWKFFPTWVGPQAPCTGYPSRMSSDPTVAYDQGVAEADLAVERLAELGLTYPDTTGSVVYYDIEYYGTGSACRNAVNAFMNGWVSQIHARGNLAGVYGSTLCNTGLSDFLSIANIPDVIWPARWYHNQGEGFYDPDASVWNLGSCIPNTVWADHQRIRQYEGDNLQTWGDLTLGIDSNVLDGVVAVPYDFPFAKSITPAKTDLSNLSQVVFKVLFSSSVTGVDISDFVLTTNVTGTAITSVTGSGLSYSVTVSTGTGDGTIRLDVVDDDSVVDAAGFPLGGAGPANGNFTGGTVYTKPIKLESISSQDGWILESTETSGVGGSVNAGAAFLRLGDNVANQQFRAILSFDTPTLPDGAVITRVTLRFKYLGVTGVNPFTTHGNLFVDICKGAFQGNPDLESSDFTTFCSKNKALIFTNKMVNKWYSQSLSSLDYPFLNFGGLTQFRLRFKLDDNNDGTANILKIHSGNALNPGNHPQLIVEYNVP
jgi:hypothetical protein